MFTNKRMVVICDMASRTNPETLDKTKVVENASKVICEKELVGVQTQQLAQAQNINFRYSLIVDKMFYANQKYLYLENDLYKIETITQGKLPKDCKLIVSVLDDEDIKRAIETWLKNH